MNSGQTAHRHPEALVNLAHRHQRRAFKVMGSNAVRSLVIAAICVLPDCSSAQQPRANAQPLFAGKNVLIVYLSRTNNTKTVAEFIQQRVGGTMMAVELEKPYPADYEATVQQVARENETGYLPPLKTKIDRIEQYDVVFLGFPTWGMQLPPRFWKASPRAAAWNEMANIW